MSTLKYVNGIVREVIETGTVSPERARAMVKGVAIELGHTALFSKLTEAQWDRFAEIMIENLQHAVSKTRHMSSKEEIEDYLQGVAHTLGFSYKIEKDAHKIYESGKGNPE